MLCKEETLVGSSRITLELRPLAFSMLAELVHHVRQELSLPQMSRIVYLFCRFFPACQSDGFKCSCHCHIWSGIFCLPTTVL